MQVEKIAVGDWLKLTAGGQLVHWCPNPGNAGDSLIAVATEHLFRKEGINFLRIRDANSFDSKGKFVCYSGGGNLVSHYSHATSFLEKHHDSAARLVILPHTIEGNEDLLEKFSSRVTIICRELVSYAHCRAAASRAEVFAADDVALSLDTQYVSGWQLISSALAAPRAYLSYRRIFRDFAKEIQLESVLVAWRGDCEQHPSRIEPPQADLSKMFNFKAIGGKGSPRSLHVLRLSAYFFLRSIDRFSHVRTDRLHLAIAAALLGKDVELYSNDYFKNRAVYDFSLKSFPKIRFVNWNEAVSGRKRV
jgi:exopolysaccharide biosynthesis predicted pyruvyltransferase EpsI